MLEQKTIQGITDVALNWGPAGFAMFLVIAHWVHNHLKIAAPISETQKQIEELEKDITRMQVELEKRVSFEWIEKMLVDKVARIELNLDRLKSQTEAEQRGINNSVSEMMKDLKLLSNAIIGTIDHKGLMHRIDRLEEKVNGSR